MKMESEVNSSDEKTSTTAVENTITSTEQMFLLECQVNRVLISNPDLRIRLGSDDLILCESTRLTVTFMNFPEIELCEDEGRETYGFSKLEPNSGKSCLFALSEKQLQPFMNPPVPACSFPVQIRLYSLDSVFCGDSNSRTPIGCCAVPMGELFSEMLAQSNEIMDAPLTCGTKQEYPITDFTGTEIGSMFACVRISCFGKMILAPLAMGSACKKQDENDSLPCGTEKTREMTEGSGIDPCSFGEEVTHGRYLPAGSEYSSTNLSKSGCGAGGLDSDTDWMDHQRSGPKSKQFRDDATDAYPEMPEQEEFRYEEIRASVNGHSLFFKILKKGKASRALGEAGGKDGQAKFPAVEGPNLGDSRRCQAATRCAKKNEAERREDVKPLRKSNQRVPNACGRNAGRSLQAMADRNGGYRVALDPKWERELKSEGNMSDGLVPIDEPNAGKAALVDGKAKGIPAKQSKSKEIFSISVGEQVMMDGKARPKLVLEIRAPKTKEDLDEEEAAIDAAEDRQKRREDRKRASGLVSDETQYVMSDFGPPEGSNVNPGKKEGKKKGKKGKK